MLLNMEAPALCSSPCIDSSESSRVPKRGTRLKRLIVNPGPGVRLVGIWSLLMRSLEVRMEFYDFIPVTECSVLALELKPRAAQLNGGLRKHYGSVPSKVFTVAGRLFASSFCRRNVVG